MRFLSPIRSCLQAISIIVFCMMIGLSSAFAQDSLESVTPAFTAQSLEERITALETNADLSNDQRDQIRTALLAAVEQLNEATRQSERHAQFASSTDNAALFQADLDNELEAAQEALEAENAPMEEMIGDDALFDLEQELISQESNLADMETSLQSLQDELIALSARQTAAPQELLEARAALTDLQTRVNTLGDGELEALSGARRTEIRARIWYRRNQIRALEQEIATLPLRQELLIGRRSVADIEAQILRSEVARLSKRTGKKRLAEAQDLKDRINSEAAELDTSHVLVKDYVQRNLDLADQIAALAVEAPDISQATASVRGHVVEVENDLSAAVNLVALGRLDRAAGDTLRRLGYQLQTPDSIRSDMRGTQSKLATATRQRIIAQEDLRDLPHGVFDLDVLINAAKEDTPGMINLSEADKEILSTIVDTRRDLLRQISTLSNTRINTLAELQSAQEALLEKTERLKTLLDENLLWVRSLPSLDISFPKKVAVGAFQFFSPRKLSFAFRELLGLAKTYMMLVVGFLMLVAFVYRFRPRVRTDVDRRATMVGRVKEDHAWHTPAVIGAGLFNSLPLPMIFLLLSFLFKLSINPDRLIQGLGTGFAFLSAYALVFGAWIRWDRKNGLFDAHFKIPEGLRLAIGRNLKWFVPVMCTVSFVLAVTSDLGDENITEGFSVFVFMLTAISMMIFSGRILLARKKEAANFGSDSSPLVRFRGLIAFILIGLPLITIGMTAAGYYESANQLLFRMLMTGVLVLLTYVAYGAIRRAIVVAQRQLKYRQALEKREAELKARREKEIAEERGEDIPPPPPIDTEEIDVTTLTRQSSKLLQTLILLGFAALLWMIWSPLLPALSIFDDFEVWSYTTGALDLNNNPIEIAVSVWDIFRSLVILILTFIAARNFPGFLEIFVLNRMGIDAGTRYAVTTILGYIIIAAGIIIGFNQLGLQWSQLRWIATGLSVGIGFGLQKIIANFISGLIILFERPIRIGDYVTIGEQSGTVSRIQIRATTLRDLDNREILIPNEALISERVTNWTLSSSVTRLIVPVGIAYGSDTDSAREIILEAVRDLPKVLKSPVPNVLFMGFGESSLDFEVHVFLKTFDDRVPMNHVIMTEINKALAAANISIPFPQHDLNIVSHKLPLDVLPEAKPKTSMRAKPKKT